MKELPQLEKLSNKGKRSQFQPSSNQSAIAVPKTPNPIAIPTLPKSNRDRLSPKPNLRSQFQP